MKNATNWLRIIKRNNHGTENSSPLKKEKSELKSEEYRLLRYEAIQEACTAGSGRTLLNLDCKTFRQAVGPTQRPMQWVPGGNEAGHVQYLYVEQNLKLEQGCTKSGHLVASTTKCFRVASNISGSSVSNMLHVTLLAPRIWRWLLNCWTICATLEDSYTTTPSTLFHAEYRSCRFNTPGINVSLKRYSLPLHDITFHRQYP